VVGHFASGVTVVTTVHEGERFGTTASAMSSLSLEPPMVLVCLNKQSATGAAVSASGRFAINILNEDQLELAEGFARKGGDKFAGVAVGAGARGLPLLEEALAQLECEVAEEAAGGTHTIFIAEVHDVRAGAGSPLVTFCGRFGRLDCSD
jgi:4-nitrophenol 2-monooxygenase / 4-nitrocatechol 4-monooxygenase, reductase component